MLVEDVHEADFYQQMLQQLMMSYCITKKIIHKLKVIQFNPYVFYLIKDCITNQILNPNVITKGKYTYNQTIGHDKHCWQISYQVNKSGIQVEYLEECQTLSLKIFSRIMYPPAFNKFFCYKWEHKSTIDHNRKYLTNSKREGRGE